MYYNNTNGAGDETNHEPASRLTSYSSDQLHNFDGPSLKSGGTNWKENFVASSSSQRRYLLPAADNDFMKISCNQDRMNDTIIHKSGSLSTEKMSFPQTLFNWTVNDSVAETKINVANLKSDLNMLCRDEDAKRKEHNHARGNLQEAWDKLVQLRTHISLFKSAIEEATIEDVSLQANRGSWTSSNLSFSNGSKVPLTAESAIRLGDVHGIREKVRLKEGLQRKVTLIEEFLSDLRTQLAHHSNELTRVNNTSERLLISDTISASMGIRQAVISVSKQLEEAEREYLALRAELEEVESDLASILERARCSDKLTNALAGSTLSSRDSTDANQAIYGTMATVSSEHLNNLVIAVMNGEDTPKDVAMTVREGSRDRIPPEGDKPVRCEFSLHEVLSGCARVTRLNGEEPKAYRHRLEKRLFSLLVLDQQLQEELLLKTEDVRRARDQLREVEVIRLRVELQVTNVESNLRQLLSESSPTQGPGAGSGSGSGALSVPRPQGEITRSFYPTPYRGSPRALTPNTGASKVPTLSLMDADYSLSNSMNKGDIPGSMYSPRVSPSRPNNHSPDKPSFSTTQSQEYLYSIAQLTAHSGVKTPGFMGETPTRRASLGDLDDPSIERLKNAARLLERDLTKNPKADTYISYESYPSIKTYEPTSMQLEQCSSPVPVTASTYQLARPSQSPKVPAIEIYDSKSGRRLSPTKPVSASKPVSVSKGVAEEKEKNSSERHSGSPGRALERARGLISMLESERELSHTDSEGHTDQNGGQESPNLSDGDGGKYPRAGRSEPKVQSPRKNEVESLRGLESAPGAGPVVVSKDSSSARTVSPKGRGRSRSPWDEKRMSQIPMPIRGYISPSKLRPHELGIQAVKGSVPAPSDPMKTPPLTISELFGGEDYISYSNEMKGTPASALVSVPAPPQPPMLPCASSKTAESLKKLAACQAKLVEVLKTELVNHETGIAMDRDGNSLGVLNVLVMSARNLPEMKKLAHSADAFVEIQLVWGRDPPPHSEEQQDLPRTSVQWNNLFPEWRERLRIAPVLNLSQQLLITLKDATKTGENISIGQCLLPLSKLLNQTSHCHWIPLEPAVETRKSARIRAKFHENCAVRVEVKLTYCKRIFLQQRFDAMLDRLKQIKLDGDLLLPNVPPKKTTADIVSEALRIRSAGGGRKSSEMTEEIRRGVRGRRCITTTVEGGLEEKKREGRGTTRSPCRTSSPTHSPHTDQRPKSRPPVQIKDRDRDLETPMQQPKKTLRVLGVRERQEERMSAPELFCRDTEGLTIGSDGKQHGWDADTHATPATNLNSTCEKDVMSVKKVPKKASPQISNSAVEALKGKEKEKDRQEDITGMDGSLSSPDMSIFKSSRARLALKRTNKDKITKCKPSSAFGTTCWTAPLSPP